MDDYDYLNRRLINQLREKVAEVRKLATSTDTGLYDAVDQLEADIGRVLLTMHSVVELLIDKGLLTQAEIAAKSQELDELDGTADGKLHPAYFRTTEENERRLTTKAFLRQLQSKEFVTPKDFLASLEAEQTDPTE